MDTPTLTAEQSRLVAAHPGEPVRVVDPAGGAAYVLVPAAVYDRVKDLLGDTRPADAYPAVDWAFAAGWDGPEMDVYDYEQENRG